MIGEGIRVVLLVLLGVLFAYLYAFIEHGYIPPAEYLQLRFLNHFAVYHLIMFGLFSTVPLIVLVFEPNPIGLFLSLGLWVFLPLGEDFGWYHFAGIWPGPEDWTSWGGGLRIGKRWVPKWYLLNSVLAIIFYASALFIGLR